MLARLRLLQMSSPALPIGGYSHSHGLEAAVEAGLVRDEAAVLAWISDMLTFSVGSYEVPSLEDMAAAWSAADLDRLVRLNDEFLATRESAELRSATVQMGFSLRALLAALPECPCALIGPLKRMPEPSLPCVWSGAAQAWSISAADSVAGYLWSWAENQVLVAMKSVPIGQSAGQRVLLKIGLKIAMLVEQRDRGPAKRRSNFAPGLALLSAQHETQYSRLFRS